MRWWISGLLTVLVAGPAQAVFYDGNRLYEWCATPEGDPRYSWSSINCNGYVTGVIDSLEVAEKAGSGPITVCVPSGATVQQVRDVVLKYLTNHPEQRHTAAAILTILALREAFPCSR